jgi:hypothetical protein
MKNSTHSPGPILTVSIAFLLLAFGLDLPAGEKPADQEKPQSIEDLRTEVKENTEGLGAENTSTVISRVKLAMALEARQMFAESEVERRFVLGVLLRLRGPEHLVTISSRNDLATALAGLKKFAEAEAECRAILAVKERTPGPKHPDTLGCHYNLANCLIPQGKIAEALQHVKTALDGFKQGLGAGHRVTMQLQKLHDKLCETK